MFVDRGTRGHAREAAATGARERLLYNKGTSASVVSFYHACQYEGLTINTPYSKRNYCTSSGLSQTRIQSHNVSLSSLVCGNFSLRVTPTAPTDTALLDSLLVSINQAFTYRLVCLPFHRYVTMPEEGSLFFCPASRFQASAKRNPRSSLLDTDFVLKSEHVTEVSNMAKEAATFFFVRNYITRPCTPGSSPRQANCE